MNIEEQIAWAAGFIDGEGGLYLTKTGRTTEITRCPMLKATQIDPEPLYRLRDLFGGRVAARAQPTSTGKIAHDWTITGGTNLGRVLPLLLPYLTVKAKEAEILLRYTKVMRRPGSGSYRLSQTERQERLDLIGALAKARKRFDNDQPIC